ncbi:MAG: hypothetical protein HWN81_16360 [Candidatus Lokiarchaeota archaeon]|nr:hypothetical protein [Candidatus Lokiarchaeota archaeon]
MKKKINAENSSKEESKSLDDNIQLYTHIVREISENLKNRKDMINKILYNETDLDKTVDIRKHFEHLRNQKKLLYFKKVRF